MSEKSLQSVLQEHRLFPSPRVFARDAYPGQDALRSLHEQAQRDPEGFWAGQARSELQWHKPFTQVLDDSRRRPTSAGSPTASSMCRATAWMRSCRRAAMRPR